MAEEPKDKDTTKNKFGFLKNKWIKITVVGMAGLLAVVWATAVWLKP